MGHSVDFAGTNCTQLPPAGAENIGPLRCFDNGHGFITSCWELSPDELAEIARTGRVFVTIMTDKPPPPVFAGSEAATRDRLADYGVWRKSAGGPLSDEPASAPGTGP